MNENVTRIMLHPRHIMTEDHKKGRIVVRHQKSPATTFTTPRDFLHINLLLFFIRILPLH